MNLAFDIVTGLFLLSGSLFSLIGGVGIVRLPDFYSRLHGGGITDTLGAGLVMAGLMLQAVKVGLTAGFVVGPWLVLVKLLMILFFLLITSPTSCHALANAAMTTGLKPQVADREEESST